MKAELKALLNRLETIAEEHGEVTDTDVREQMYAAVYHGFIAQTPGYELPTEFGLFEEEGNEAVRSALADFIEAARTAAQGDGLNTAEKRFDGFQDGSVLSDGGSPYDEFFGHSESLKELANAMRRSDRR